VLKPKGNIGTARIAEAVILAFGAMILIFGIYIMLRPDPEGNDREPYRYVDWLGTPAKLEPMGTVSHSFHATEGQLISASVSRPRYTTELINDPLYNVIPDISITVMDPKENVLLELENVDQGGNIFRIKNTGDHRIDVVNNDDRLYDFSFDVWTVEKRVSPLLAFGSMLVFMSLPVIALAVWLFVVRR